MKQLLLGIVIGALGLFAYQRVRQPTPPVTEPATKVGFITQPEQPEATQESARSEFRCDGRVHCSQMTSCDEANYFVQHCPGVKMDGDRDGEPCEDRCGH
jgi:hypothetical protein